MRQVIMVCATVGLAACAAEQPVPDYTAAAARLVRPAVRLRRLLTRRRIPSIAVGCSTSQEMRTVPWRNRLNNFPALCSGRTAKWVWAVNSSARERWAFRSPAGLRLHCHRPERCTKRCGDYRDGTGAELISPVLAVVGAPNTTTPILTPGTGSCT
jgi:hypothetical protein